MSFSYAKTQENLRKESHIIMLNIVQVAAQVVIATMAVAEFVLKLFEHKKSNRPDQR